MINRDPGKAWRDGYTSNFYDLAKSVTDHTILDPSRLWEIYSHLSQVPTNGDLAELGVYRAGAARFMALACPQRTLWLFDTFSGIPETDPSIDWIKKGHFDDGTLEQAQAYLADLPNVRIVPGLFPESAAGVPESTRFSLVHLDADIYTSTMAGLEWFWPKMIAGGVVIVDDFDLPQCPGATRATKEFFTTHPDHQGSKSIPPSVCVRKLCASTT